MNLLCQESRAETCEDGVLDSGSHEIQHHLSG
jgi:hypothetical protein